MMVEQGMREGDLPAQTSLALKTTSQSVPSYNPYPPPLATYDDVVASPDLFIDTLKKLHASMRTKFMFPVVGGKHLDLHLLFVEVSSRGGIAKVLNDKKWKEVTMVFEFPSSATNASFILRKYYVSLLYHYEQIYFFKAKGWTRSPADAIQQSSTTETQRTHIASPQHRENTATSSSEVLLSPSIGSPVYGVIDGKFDNGYLVTVKIGTEEFRGVLYQVPNNAAQNFPYYEGRQQIQTESARHMNCDSSLKPRRKRRKKSEIRKRDPAHPKPNRSGYNFFFAEQHAKLKPLYHGKDREISRIIGESWNKLQEPERAVYQEKALKDKERYKTEMEDYKARLRSGVIIGSAASIQVPPSNSTDLNNEENEMSSNKSDKSNLEEEDESTDKDLDFGEFAEAGMELKNVDIGIMADDALDFQTRVNSIGQDSKISGQENITLLSSNNNVVSGEDGITVPIEEMEEPHSNAGEYGPSQP